jgi:hypothetical protein
MAEWAPAACGQAIAAILAGSWRRSLPPLHLESATLESVAGLLAAGGTGGLAWHRLREMAVRTAPAARELRQHYRLQTLQAVDRESSIRELLPRLRDAGVEPILIKGWSSARLYPEPGLRPCCDVDLCVPAPQIRAASDALSAAPLPCAVDLHADVPDLVDRPWQEVFRRSRLVALDDIPVRILGPEDELRLLCLHLARHGIARPLWLCDVAACLESLPAEFDWDYWLWGSKHLTDWAVCVFGLACRLLDARLGRQVPTVLRDPRVPGWVERAVLWCWGAGPSRPARQYLCQPVEMVRQLRYHGISPKHGSAPVKAALHLGVGPNRRLPLLLVQVAAFARRKVPHVLKRLVYRRRRLVQPFIVHKH